MLQCVPMRCDQRREILGLLSLPVLTDRKDGERVGVRGAPHGTSLPLTPSLSPLQERGEGVRPNLWHRCASTSPERALAQLGTSSFARWADVAIGSSKLVGTLAPWLACDVVTFTPLCIPARRDRRATTVGSLGAVI